MKQYIIIVFTLIVSSCTNKQSSNHAHNSDGSHIKNEIPRISYTKWTKNLELFVEFPSLIVGETSKFATHITILDKHQPVTKAKVTVSLIKEDKGIRTVEEKPTSPGIFSPKLKPLTSGLHQLVFDVSTPEFNEKITIENVMVYTDLNEVNKNVNSEENSISFLKEQAWKMNFQTKMVTKGTIYNIISSYGEWQVAQNSIKNMVATSNGIVNFANTNLTNGTKVTKGQLLMTISSKNLNNNNLNSSIIKAKSNLEQLNLEYNRKKELFDLKIIPKAEFEKIENKLTIAQAEYQTLTLGVFNGNKQIRAPFSGFIKEVHTSNGNYVNQGNSLISIGTHNSKILKISASPSQHLTSNTIQNIWYQNNEDKWNSIFDTSGKILSITKEVNKTNPLLAIFAKVNDEINKPEGSLSQVQIAYGDKKEAVLVPESALLESFGSYSVIVQLGGENFERRDITIGKRNGKYVEVLKGLNQGEMVVTTGAYSVKMASMSGSTPAHGQEH